MFIPHDVICSEIKRRISQVQSAMTKRGYEALLVYGNNKVYGSLRYLSEYFPDRAGWISFSGTETYVYDGAVLVVPASGDPTLILDPGLMPGRDICVGRMIAGGIASRPEDSLSAEKLARILNEYDATRRIGIETWDRFPAPLYLGMIELFPDLEVERSTVVEELRMVKSPLEVEILRKAAMVGDKGHQAFTNTLRDGIGKTQLEIVRQAEWVMRRADPIYEDAVTNSPSLICSGFPVGGSLLHLPTHTKTIQPGDAVHWDICTRYNGYAIDTSRTKVVGKPTTEQQRAYEVTVEMLKAVIKTARPGVPSVELVEKAQKVAQESGYELWDGFLGHGIGIDAHERPDLVREQTPLKENMVLAIEPRIVIDDTYILGLEDMVLITKTGGVSFNQYEWTPLEL